MSSVGFSGTQSGMTIVQWRALHDELITAFAGIGPHEWHDGDCIGADDMAHRTVEQFNRLRARSARIEMHGHPCNIDSKRAFNEFDVMHEVKAPLVRNKDIIVCSETMYFGPKEYNEQMRGSGTWAAMRHTVKQQRELVVCWPDGEVERDFVPPSLKRKL